MNTSTPTKISPRTPLSRQQVRALIEQQRETIASLIALGHSADRPVLFELFNTTTEMWNACQPDEAPAYEPRFQMDRAS